MQRHTAGIEAHPLVTAGFADHPLLQIAKASEVGVGDQVQHKLSEAFECSSEVPLVKRFCVETFHLVGPVDGNDDDLGAVFRVPLEELGEAANPEQRPPNLDFRGRDQENQVILRRDEVVKHHRALEAQASEVARRPNVGQLIQVKTHFAPVGHSEVVAGAATYNAVRVSGEGPPHHIPQPRDSERR